MSRVMGAENSGTVPRRWEVSTAGGAAIPYRGVAELALLASVALPLLFGGLRFSFLDPDDGLYGDMARAMARGVGLVVPQFNGLAYLEKPPLFLWLASVSLSCGLPAEWAMRAWSSLGAFGSAVLAWRMSGRVHGRSAGLLSGLALITMAGSALYVRKVSTDLLFVFFFTLAIHGFVRDAESGQRGWRRFLWMYAGMALGVLTKGLIGAVLPMLVIAGTMAWVRGLSWRDLNLRWGVPLFAALVVPWHAAAAWQAPDLFRFYLFDNQILRFLGLRSFLEDDVPVTVVGFLLVTFVWLFPWGVFLLARQDHAGGSDARWRPIFAVWVLVVIGFFLASRSTLEYYALPAFPAVAVMVGGAWASGRDIGRWLGIGLVGCVVVGAWSVWLGGRLAPEQTLWGLAELNVYYRILRDQGLRFPFESARPFGLLVQILGGTLIVGWGAATVCWWRRWRTASFAALVATACVIAMLIVQLLGLVAPHHSTRAVAEAINVRAAVEDVVAHEGSLEYSAALPFYTGRRIVVVNGARGDLEFASRRPEARGWFVDDRGLQALWAGSRRVFMVTQQYPDRTVVARLPRASVYQLGHFGSRWLYSNKRD
jgi:dolichyl-phosphate-mannose-protein mannosyltransferase